MTKLTQEVESSTKDLAVEDLASMEDLVKNYLEYQGRYKRPQTLQEDQKLIQDIISFLRSVIHAWQRLREKT